ncbi:MAG: DUF5017 domain-containing protein [Bacteroidales bacterium]|nr:DUF5017 domain-containing protein [Bacteroidales bacterium]
MIDTMITRFKIIAAALSAILFSACNKDYELVSPDDFSVEAPSVVKAGQGVNFTLGGNPDLIMFFSGEFGHVFAGRDNPTLYPGTMSLSFVSETSTSSTPGMNPGHMALRYSTDFSGIYTTEAVNAATWTDISDRFAWPVAQGQSVSSGEVCIDDIFPKDGGAVYFRLDYRVTAFDEETQPDGRVQWINKDFTINGGTVLLTRELYNHYTLGWQIVGIENYDQCSSSNLPQMPTSSKHRIAFRTQFKPEVDIEYAAVSAPVSPTEGIVIKDEGVSIKTAMDPRLAVYRYTYQKAGEYDVTFSGINANRYGNIEVPRTVRIKVVEDGGNVHPINTEEWK